MATDTIAVQLEAAVSETQAASAIMRQVANGDANTQVTTESGPVPSIAKWFATLDERTEGALDEVKGQLTDQQGQLTAQQSELTTQQSELTAQQGQLTDQQSQLTAAGTAISQKLPLVGGTLTGPLHIAPAGNALLDMGRVDGVASTPQIAFHSGAVATSYDSNIYAVGGNGANGNGSLAYAASAGHSFTGPITCNGNITAFSDIRLKADIQVITDALEKVCSLRGVTYERTDTGERQTGLIAQEVQAVLPEAVTVGSDEIRTLSVAYGNLVGLLVESIKELTARVEALEK